MAEVISALHHQPAVIGHSFGGLITQQLQSLNWQGLELSA
jgi:pimeloyl-ACP methyl ester carboxylesterase